jgi:hypothetical protein
MAVRPRRCKNKFRKFKVVIGDFMVAVLVLWVGYSRQYMYDSSAGVGGNILSMPAIGVLNSLGQDRTLVTVLS